MTREQWIKKICNELLDAYFAKQLVNCNGDGI